MYRSIKKAVTPSISGFRMYQLSSKDSKAMTRVFSGARMYQLSGTDPIGAHVINYKLHHRNWPGAKLDLPRVVDWEHNRVLNRVRDQGRSSSSWAIAAVTTVEAAIWLKKKRRVRLSVQELLDCAPSYGIHGGRIDLAFDYIREYGIGFEKDYQYDGLEDMPSRLKQYKKREYISDYVRIPQSEIELKKELQYGPVGLALAVGQKFLDLKKDKFDVDRDYTLKTDSEAEEKLEEQYECAPTSDDKEYEEMRTSDEEEESKYEKKILKWEPEVGLSHAVVAAGYNDDEEKFKLLNSCSKKWGRNGYFKLPMDTGYPYGQCRLLEHMYRPIVK